MLAFNITHGGRELSLELPLPTEAITGELRDIGLWQSLHLITQDKFTLQPANKLGEHFMKLVQPDDTLRSIAMYCKEFEVLAGESRQALEDLVLADRFRDLDHMADYLQYGPDALDGLMRMEYNGQSAVLPMPQREFYNRFGMEKPMGEIRLTEAELIPASDLGKRLIAEFQPCSDTVAIANLACDMAKNPTAQADLGKFLQGIRCFQAPMPTQIVEYFCPLKVSVEECDSWNLIEGAPGLLADHENEIRDALKDHMPDDKNMANYLPDDLRPKIASAEWDVAKVAGALYGKISCELRAPLAAYEQTGLVEWITGQNSDGLGEGFEQHPVDTDDGELYVHLWHSGEGYFVRPAEEFFQQLHEQSTLEQAQETIRDSGFPIGPGGDLHTLNQLAQRIESMDEYEQETLCAWVNAQESCSADDALHASHNLHCIDFHPVSSDEMLGEFALDSDFFDEYNDLPDEVFDMLDRAKVGVQYREQVGGVFVNGGFLMVSEFDEQAPEEELVYEQTTQTFGEMTMQ